jgi:hypothetical protein
MANYQTTLGATMKVDAPKSGKVTRGTTKVRKGGDLRAK